MFASYNLKTFGLQLKKIRESIGYSQNDVQNLCGINTDTLRRIENGYTIPKYDTLELLSQIYKIDLLNILRKARSHEQLYSYYERLDSLISSYNIEILKDLDKDFQAFVHSEESNKLVNNIIYSQFTLILKGIREYYQEDKAEVLNSLYTFEKAIKCSVSEFTIENFQEFNYNLFELRILLLVALALSEHKKYELSNKILNYILDEMISFSFNDIQVSLLIIKVYLKLAYNFHNLSEDEKTLEYAVKGIDYSVENNIMFALYALYYRKGIAEFMLSKEDYIDSLHKSIQILEIQEKFDLAKLYKDITLDKYKILIK